MKDHPYACHGCNHVSADLAEVNNHVCPGEKPSFAEPRFIDPESKGSGATCGTCGYSVTAHHPGMSSTLSELADLMTVFTKHHRCVKP